MSASRYQVFVSSTYLDWPHKVLITAESGMSVSKTQHVYWKLSEVGKTAMTALRAVQQ